MNISLGFIENLATQLPNAEVYQGVCYRKEFIWMERYFELKFYIVQSYVGGPKSWLCNPNHVQGVTRNGSHIATVNESQEN